MFIVISNSYIDKKNIVWYYWFGNVYYNDVVGIIIFMMYKINLRIVDKWIFFENYFCIELWYVVV